MLLNSNTSVFQVGFFVCLQLGSSSSSTGIKKKGETERDLKTKRKSDTAVKISSFL